MALSESVLSELLDAFRVGEGVDLIRDAVRLVLQELIETEAIDVIGAARYERTSSRTNERNGHRSRTLTTKAGDVELKIPKLRQGSFFPSILEPRRRIDQALYAVVMQAYVEGVSTPSVDVLVAALGIDSGISKSQVLRICTHSPFDPRERHRVLAVVLAAGRHSRPRDRANGDRAGFCLHTSICHEELSFFVA